MFVGRFVYYWTFIGCCLLSLDDVISWWMFQWRSGAFARATIGHEKTSWRRFLVIYGRQVVWCYGNVTCNKYRYLVADWLRGEHFQPIRETCSSILFVLQPYCSASQWNSIKCLSVSPSRPSTSVFSPHIHFCWPNLQIFVPIVRTAKRGHLDLVG